MRAAAPNSTAWVPSLRRPSHRRGPSSHAAGPAGFTIIELILATALLALLTGIAVSTIYANRTKVYMDVMKADLRHLALMEEDFYAKSTGYFGESFTRTRYSGSLQELEFIPSQGVTIELQANDVGWTAMAVHDQLRGKGYVCAAFIGRIEPYPPAVNEGVVACSPHDVNEPVSDGQDEDGEDGQGQGDGEGQGGGKGKGGGKGQGQGGGQGQGSGGGNGQGNGGGNGQGNGGGNGQGNGGGNGQGNGGGNGQGNGGGTGG